MTTKQKNLEKLKKIIENNSNEKYVYFKRTGNQEDIIDIPIKQAELIIKVNHTWAIVESVNQIDDELNLLFDDEDKSIPEFSETNSTKLPVPSVPEPIDDEEFNKLMATENDSITLTRLNSVEGPIKGGKTYIGKKLPVGKASKKKVRKKVKKRKR